MRNITAILGLPFNFPIEDITDQLPKHPTKTYALRNIEDIDTITVHHFASEAPLINQAAYHVNGHDWPGIGYHMVISDGRLLQTNNLLAESYHSSGHNHHSVAISIRGDLSKRPLTSLERDLLYMGILTLKHYLPHVQYIVGHNEQGKTSCPCISMNEVRENIATLEQRMKQAASWAGKIKEVNGLFNQMKYMGDLIQKGESDGGANWSMNELLDVIAIMKSKKLL